MGAGPAERPVPRRGLGRLVPAQRPSRSLARPARPKTRILAAGEDACRLLERLHRHAPGYRPGPRTEAPPQIVMENYHRDAAGRLRWRTADDGGLPPSSSTIVSPYDTTARYVRPGHIIRWKGVAAHVTETCASGSAHVITDVATTSAATNDTQALARYPHPPGPSRAGARRAAGRRRQHPRTPGDRIRAWLIVVSS
ncbi:hypothetical protein F7R91_25565 [Streptomyces luteolifulvus]|uniref:Uncharacterized protein n=1 Tax=Streptomyces luteolifulvus TaxID=2615112 RepID=A0A6H9UWK3_9ACTN|nr:hypothetical protein [Streptomyces luteolifulvus]KAB1143514.1 hypothetical protein F7R91_25565 [Streptomyces luteolifulvus]